MVPGEAAVREIACCATPQSPGKFFVKGTRTRVKREPKLRHSEKHKEEGKRRARERERDRQTDRQTDRERE